MSWLLALLLLLPLSVSAQTGNLSGGSSKATGSSTARTLADRAADVVNVKDFGAVGNDTTDDTVAINAAITYVRNNLNPGAGVVNAKLVFPQGVYKITAPLNFTALQGIDLIIDFSGAAIDCQTVADVCTDWLGSRYLTVLGLSMESNGGTPTYAVQAGRYNGTVADELKFINPSFFGNYSKATFYAFGSEGTTLLHPTFYNGGTGYCLVLDGLNHFNITSHFVTQTNPVDTAVSFNAVHVIDMDCRQSGGKPGVWMAHADGVRFDNFYIGNSGGANQAIWLYALNGDRPSANSYFQGHVETASVSDVFLLTGTLASQSIPGLDYDDISAQSSNSIFKLDTGVTSATLTNAHLAINGFSGGATKIFNAPNSWTVQGSVALPSGASQWNLPAASFSGCLGIGSAVTGCTANNFTLADPTSPLILYPAAGIGFPSFTTRTAGTKLVLYPQVDGTDVDYGIGVAANNLWFSVPTTAGQFNFFGGNSSAATLSGAGVMSLASGGSYQINGVGIVLSGTTANIGGGALAAGECTSGTATVTGATSAMSVAVSPSAQPQADASHGLSIWGFVSAAGTVTVEVCAIVATTPVAKTYNVRVLQ